MSEETYLPGRERSRAWWMLDVEPRIQHTLPHIYPYISAGLVGDGSDCFGYDDEISLDHDTHTRIKLWIPLGAGGSETMWQLQSALSSLSGGAVEVEEITAFYRRYTGLDTLPHTWQEWYAIPELNLAAATNGEVFYDGSGRFTQRREVLKKFYPEDVRLKLLEKRLLVMGQSGQYNYDRCLRRGEVTAAGMHKAAFIEAAISAVFLLNRRYMPFKKWAPRAMKELPLLGNEVAAVLEEMTLSHHAQDLIEKVSGLIREELSLQHLCDNDSDFLVNQAAEIRKLITIDELRKANSWKQ